MLKIRLARVGKRNRPFYKVIVVDKKLSTHGVPTEVIGFFDPAKKEKKIDLVRFEFWKTKGAQPSATVNKLVAALK